MVLRAEPFQLTTELLTKLEPLAVRVKPTLPIAALVWLMLLRTGSGLLIVKVRGEEVPPPGVGLETVTAAEPVDSIRLPGTVAAS